MERNLKKHQLRRVFEKIGTGTGTGTGIAVFIQVPVQKKEISLCGNLLKRI